MSLSQFMHKREIYSVKKTLRKKVLAVYQKDPLGGIFILFLAFSLEMVVLPSLKRAINLPREATL